MVLLTLHGRPLTVLYYLAPKNKAQKMSMSSFLNDESEQLKNSNDKRS